MRTFARTGSIEPIGIRELSSKYPSSTCDVTVTEVPLHFVAEGALTSHHNWAGTRGVEACLDWAAKPDEQGSRLLKG
jgi:hypothetical protein